MRKLGCQAMKQEASYIICNPPVGYVKWNPYHAGKQRDMCDECMRLRPYHLGDGTMRRPFARSLRARWKNRNTSKDLRHGVCTAEWKWLNCSCDGNGNLNCNPTQLRLQYCDCTNILYQAGIQSGVCSNYKTEKQETYDVQTTMTAENKGAWKETDIYLYC
jgi:hypothetical protein